MAVFPALQQSWPALWLEWAGTLLVSVWLSSQASLSLSLSHTHTHTHTPLLYARRYGQYNFVCIDLPPLPFFSGAIASIAFGQVLINPVVMCSPSYLMSFHPGQACGAVDGNVVRVLSRLRAIAAEISNPRTMEHFW